MAHKRKEPPPSSSSLTNNTDNDTGSGSGNDDIIQVRRPRLLSSLIHPREYHGTYHNGSIPCVTISNGMAMEELHVRGCYGKPSLSRGQPAIITAREQKSDADGVAAARAPYETLELTLVEAFWLMHALGCLHIHRQPATPIPPSSPASMTSMTNSDNDDRGSGRDGVGAGDGIDMMTMDECWNEFRHVSPRFVALCSAYYYLRARAWVVKSGLKFGVDYTIYQDGPAFTHAQYSVIVEWVTNTDTSQSSSSSSMSEWNRLQNLLRMTQSVAKSLCICYVRPPSSSSSSSSSSSVSVHADEHKKKSSESMTVKSNSVKDADITCLNDPQCMSHMTIDTMIVKRWTPRV